MPSQISQQMKRDIVNYCNAHIVPDEMFNARNAYPSDWFINYFDFIDNQALRKHLGEAFYQARFLYKLMSALSLPLAKNKGILKFQIIQYASINEAVLDYTIDKYFREEIKSRFARSEYTPVKNSLSASTKITYEGEELIPCKRVVKAQTTKLLRIQDKTDFAVEKGIISEELRSQMCALFNTRNNVHILKAVSNDYNPKIIEAKNAFEFMMTFVTHIKRFRL